ncbi:MAG: ABC transporter substrate-binding protein, partial [Porcincola intestinalis]|nr:ABC transporter substrate-binding protein [Porcincola intestinalis]
SYVPAGLEDDKTGLTSQIRMDMETFLTEAKDADFLIYDATIVPISSVQELLEIDPIFGRFKAVAEGHVFITKTNMYQNSDKTGSIIRDFHSMLTGKYDMEYISKAE